MKRQMQRFLLDVTLIISAIVLRIQKPGSEDNRAFSNANDLNVSNQNTIYCWAKFYSKLFYVTSLITHI